MTTKEIYIRLLEEGTDVFRPTQGEEISEGIYRVLPTVNYDPEDEVWEFLPGTIVRCKEKAVLEGTKPKNVLVATEQVVC